MTFYEVKSYLKNIFQFLGDTSHQDFRLWILKDDMLFEDFIDSYN
jgi:hypothetical protein